MLNKNRGALGALLLPVCSLGILASAVHAQDVSRSAVMLEEIVVTAQKRSEDLQSVPVTVSLVSAEQMAMKNITSVDELSRAAPAISFNGGIRGVATGGFTRSSEEAVSVVLDGVPMGRTKIANLFDVERVEVLSGPQGMLFGKNASAGVINIITHAPDPTIFEVIGSVDTGNFDRQQQRLTVNAPLGQDAALRVSLHNRQQSHGLKNVFTGDELEDSSYGGRARFLWEPSDNLAVNLTGDWEKSEGSGEQGFVFAVASEPGVVERLADCGITASLDNSKTCADGINEVIADNKRWGLSAQVDYTLDSGHVLTSVTARRDWQTGDKNFFGEGGDTDLFPEDILNRNLAPGSNKVFTQEFRITSPGGEKIDYVAGLFYWKEEQTSRSLQAGRLGLGPVLDQFFYPGAITARGSDFEVEQESMAVFGQATLRLTDKWSLIAGGRYTDETLEEQVGAMGPERLAELGFVYFPAWSGTFVSVDEKVETDNFSWRLGAQYDWTPDVMTFFSVARGYKGPAINDVDQISDQTKAIIDEEIPTNYELGVRANLFDQRVFAALTAFYTKVEDFQTQIYVPATEDTPVPGFANGNAPYIKTKGVNLEMMGRLTEHFSFNLGVVYTDAEFAPGFRVGCSLYQQRTGTCQNPESGSTESIGDVPNVSDWRVLLGASYTRPIGDFEVFVQSDLTYESGFSMSSSYDPLLEMPDRTFLGARAGVRTSDGRWGLSIWGRNLLDKYYPTLSPDPLSGFNGGGNSTYVSSRNVNLYRTYGATLDFRF